MKEGENLLLAELERVLGHDEAMELIRRYGGRRVYMPLREKSSVLADVLSPEAIAKLRSHYGGSGIRVPMANCNLARWLHRKKGWTVERIAESMRFRVETVRAWLLGETTH